MPEMPEVRTVTRDMNKIVKDKTFDNVLFLVEKIMKDTTLSEFYSHIKNEKIELVSNIGKWIVFYLSNGKIVLSHLRMTGTYYFFQEKPKKILANTGVIFKFTDGSELHYVDARKFGTMHIKFKNTFLNEKPLIGLGKEPQETNLEEFWNSLQKTSRAIKTVILDQKHVLGFGNIYVDETLWAINVHPETPSKKILKEEAKQILKEGARIMDHSTKLGGSSIQTYGSVNGKPGRYQNYLQVFGKQNTPCKKCQTLLTKIWVNGRGTTFCPNCQIKKH